MPKYSDNFVHRGKVIEFNYATGEVIGTNKFSETHVTSSGGGGTVTGYVGPYGGNVGGNISAPQINSEVVTKHEFWIRTHEGKEIPIKLAGVDIPLRAGQMITIFLARRKGNDTGSYCILVNHNAGNHWFINDAKGLNKALKIETPTGFSVLIALAFIVGCFFLLREIDPYGDSGLWPFIFAAATVFVFYRAISKLIRASSLKRRLQKYLDNLVQFAVQNFSSRSFTAGDALKAAKAAQAKAQADGQSSVLNINIDNT